MISHELPPLGGGGGKVAYELAAVLSKLGYDLDVVTMRFTGLPAYERVNGINVYRISCLRRRKANCSTLEMLSFVIMALPKVLHLHRKHKYQLNHTHFIFPSGMLSYLVSWVTRLPYLITAHGSDVAGYNPHQFKFQHRWLAPLWCLIVRRATGIICPSKRLEALVQAQTAKASTEVIPNGLHFNPMPDLESKEKNILLVSRMLERKGFQYFLKAAAGLDYDFQIHIVGDGPYLKELKTLARDLGVEVTFWGWLDNDSAQLKHLYETSSIFVLPSESENFPIVLLEAMSMGLAIITTTGIGCDEVVGEAALLVEPKNPAAIRRALVLLIENPALRREQALAGRLRLEKLFNWDVVTRQHENLYSQSVGALLK